MVGSGDSENHSDDLQDSLSKFQGRAARIVGLTEADRARRDGSWLLGNVSMVNSERFNPHEIKQQNMSYIHSQTPSLSTIRADPHSLARPFYFRKPKHNYSPPTQSSQRVVLFLCVCLSHACMQSCTRVRSRLPETLTCAGQCAGGLWERRRRWSWRVLVGQRTCCGYKHSGTANVLRADRNPPPPPARSSIRPSSLLLGTDRLPL